MPEERDIEKSLRAWARRRREDAGAPVELHPAARRLLQDEVSRLKAGRRQETATPGRLFWGSPLRLALNLAAVAIVLIIGTLVLTRLWRTPSPSTAVQLSQNDRRLQGNASVAPAVAKDALNKPEPVAESFQDASKETAGVTTHATNAISLAYNRRMVETPAPPPTPAPAAAMPAAPSALDQGRLAATNTANTAVNYDQSAAAFSLDGTVMAQKFLRLRAPTEAVRSDRLAADGLRAEAVLNSFQMEQSGGQLRVIDDDGSVYTGSLTAPDKMPKSAASLSAAQSRSFRVSGTNLTCKQLVVFTGNLVFADQASLGMQTVSGNINGVAPGGAVGGGGFGGAAGAFKAAWQTNVASAPAAPAAAPPAAAAAPQPLLNFHIEGRALVGTNEIQINAVPSKP